MKVTSTTRRTSRPVRPARLPRSSVQAKALVRAGWNAASRFYRPDGARKTVFGLTAGRTLRWLRPLFARLPDGAKVIDLGCGCGLPATRQLARRFEVTGVDLSDTQIARARRLVPEAKFVRADMTRIRIRANSVQGVVALYSLIHLPLEEQRPLLARIHRWLTPDGLLVLVAGHLPYTGVEADWLGSGATMYWAHADAGTYARWLREIGFVVERQAIVREPGASHTLFVARRAARKLRVRGGRAAPRHPAPVRR
jgi:SAM-dependent methyltransferase